MSQPERNEALLRKVGDVIANEPERYWQGDWLDQSECGTTACVAGHTVMVHPDFDGESTYHYVDVTVSVAGEHCGIPYLAMEMLGLTEDEAAPLFDPLWEPAGDPSVPLHERVQAALYALAEGASVEEVSA